MVTRTKKIFVGGLSANTVVEDVKQYFEQFGKIFAEGCQCSTAHHPRAPGNMSPHHLVNKTFSKKPRRCMLLI
ncbi:unnamed protein product [Tetraodon nigroviridis]|uniref:(spotted green pufferfish) hypothetical protein n=1 Tax=Tetraodon nigroviridis TaxID=99883 RepID=Q4S8P0_TETNG|nr:unnamed protein product [Tetraodon nigroviridis]